MTRSMLQHLGTACRIVGVLVTSLALASFTVQVHSTAPASEWLRWFCVFGATIAAAVVVGCFFSRDAGEHPHAVRPRFRH